MSRHRAVGYCRGIVGVPMPETTAPPGGRDSGDRPLTQGKRNRRAPPPGQAEPRLPLPPPLGLRSRATGQVSAGRAHSDPSHRLAKRPQTLHRKGPAPNPSPGPRPLPAGRSGPPTGRAHDDSSSRPTCSRSSLSGLTRSPGQTGPRQPAPFAWASLRLRLLPRFTRIRDRELV